MWLWQGLKDEVWGGGGGRPWQAEGTASRHERVESVKATVCLEKK